MWYLMLRTIHCTTKQKRSISAVAQNKPMHDSANSMHRQVEPAARWCFPSAPLRCRNGCGTTAAGWCNSPTTAERHTAVPKRSRNSISETPRNAPELRILSVTATAPRHKTLSWQPQVRVPSARTEMTPPVVSSDERTCFCVAKRIPSSRWGPSGHALAAPAHRQHLPVDGALWAREEHTPSRWGPPQAARGLNVHNCQDAALDRPPECADLAKRSPATCFFHPKLTN